MPTTYKAIATVTVGSGGTSSIDFSSIPSTYTDVLVLFSLRQDTDDRNIKITFNNSSSSIYSERVLTGSGGVVSSSNNSSQTRFAVGAGASPSPATANTFGNGMLYVPNYTNTSNNKSMSVSTASENNSDTNVGQVFYSGLWSSTSAINQITISPWASKFVQYSTATLYGIKNS